MTLLKEKTKQGELKTFPQNRKGLQIFEYIGLEHSRIAKRNIPKHLLVNKSFVHLFFERHTLFGSCLPSSAAEIKSTKLNACNTQ